VCTMKDPVCDLIIGDDWNESSVEEKYDEDENYSVNEGTLIFENTKYQEPLSDILLSQQKCSKIEVTEDNIEEILDTRQDSIDRIEMGDIQNDETLLKVRLEEEHTDNSAAVQTRGQIKKETPSIRHLKATVINAIDVTPEEFKQLQESDDRLQKYYDEAKQVSNIETSEQLNGNASSLYLKKDCCIEFSNNIQMQKY
jgi:hypothetical protein